MSCRLRDRLRMLVCSHLLLSGHSTMVLNKVTVVVTGETLEGTVTLNNMV